MDLPSTTSQWSHFLVPTAEITITTSPSQPKSVCDITHEFCSTHMLKTSVVEVTDSQTESLMNQFKIPTENQIKIDN